MTLSAVSFLSESSLRGAQKRMFDYGLTMLVKSTVSTVDRRISLPNDDA